MKRKEGKEREGKATRSKEMTRKARKGMKKKLKEKPG